MTVAAVLFLALLDSINPSAIVVTLHPLSLSGSRVVVQVGVYLGAIFVAYFAFGAMQLLGIDSVLPSLGDVLRDWIGLIAQSLVGLALLAYSLTTSTDHAPTRNVPRPSARTNAALVGLGISVTAMGLPTACSRERPEARSACLPRYARRTPFNTNVRPRRTISCQSAASRSSPFR